MEFLRFLRKYEYCRTYRLFNECFPGNDGFLDEFYGELDGEDECTGTIRDHSIAVIENENGEILSMVHYRIVDAVYGTERTEAAYIMDVATRPDCRRQGMMDRLMKVVISVLRSQEIGWCFLVAVDKQIYRHLGFIHDWRFNPDEASLLDADEGLTECSARLIQSESFRVPDRLERHQ